MTRAVANFNGITIAYAMGLVNSLLAVLTSFGVPLKPGQQAAVTAFVNAALIVLAHVGHRVGEQHERDVLSNGAAEKR